MDEKQLIKFISGQADLKEQLEVLAWIEESETNKSSFAKLKNLTVAADLVSEDYSKKSDKESLIVRKIIRWSLRAAALFVIGFSVFNYGKHQEKKTWIESSKEQITEISVPMGESVSLTLPDGSTAKLNSGSTLKFSKLFGYKDRSVSLNGEGYFIVNKSNKKFIVKTSDLDIIVLGTTFNISAYEEDKTISASLYEGHIKVFNRSISEQINLKPNDCYSYDKLSKTSNLKSVKKERDWVENYFIADSDNIEVFARKIERKYKVTINISPALIGKCVYTGAFKGETLKEILDNMALASPIKYEIKKDKIVMIYPKP